jgi:hypothetical protein
MSIIDQIEDFSAFAKTRIRGDKDLSIDELYGQWRNQAFASADAHAVAASIRDIEQGERGEPLDDFLANFDAKRSADKS